MISPTSRFEPLSDTELIARVGELAVRERHATAELIAALAELDARRLYLAQGCSSLFTYCTRVLQLSEHAAYGRIEAARAARQFPTILEALADGSLNLTAVCLLAPHLTSENHRDLLAAARFKSKREVEHLVATIRPQPDVPATVRKLPMPQAQVPKTSITAAASAPEREPVALAPSGGPEPPKRISTVAPIAPERYKIQLTVARETYEKLRRAQDLLRHSIPNGEPAAIFDRALTLLVADLEKRKLGATDRPRAPRASTSRSRHIPAAVKREVWARDGGQCAFVGPNGRCTERGFLEFHHLEPYATGGETTVENLQLRCRPHNAYEAEQYFGPMFVRYGNSVRTEL